MMKKSTTAQEMPEVTPAKPELEESSSHSETDADDINDDDALVQELESSYKGQKWLYAGLYFLVMLTLSGMAYYFFDYQESSYLTRPSTPATDTDDENWNHQIDDGSSNDDILFLPSITVHIDEDDYGDSRYHSLADSRSSLSNFDYGAYTYLRQEQRIDQDNRIERRPHSTRYYLQQQSDGNFVLFNERQHVFWSSGVVQNDSSKRYYTVLQHDGNLVTYSRRNGGSSKVEWASGTNGNSDNYNLVLSPNRDGLMIVRRNNGQIIWSTVATSSSISGSSSTSGHSSPSSSNSGRITYTPGKLNRRENGLLLSEGLRSRIVAQAGQRVVLDGRGGARSGERFHHEPDGAGVFADGNGGWAYVSNSEIKSPRGRGGVGAIYFDRHGRTTDYRMILRGTTANCSGGRTPWNTWVSCEETGNGRALQIDPFQRRGMQETRFDRGVLEAFAYDIRDRNHPRFFVTEDRDRGPLRRFSPSEKNWNDPWQLLHARGTLQWLVLEPRGGGRGTFRWTTNKDYAKRNAQQYYPYSEGVDVYGNQLFFTIKERKQLFILDLDRKTFERHSTRSGAFDGMPDQVQRIIGDNGGVLYFCEEGGGQNGVHGRNPNGWFFTILETATFNDEATGLAFSPDGKRMYVSFQRTGKIVDVWREDGLPFHGQTLNIRYH